MKINYKSVLMGVGAAVMLTACGNRDIFEDKITPGQEVPNAYWEVGSTAAKAGESFSFQGKYNSLSGKLQLSHCQVWYRVDRDESAAATVKLAGSALSYTKTVSATDTMRAYQPIVTIQHDPSTWDGYEYVVEGTVPVSRTLSPIQWVDATEWDQERFDSYYPQNFTKEFCEEVINYLTKDSTYYASLRTVYVNYPFTNELVKQVNEKYKINLPDNVDLTKDDQGAGEKSDLWYSTQTPSDKDITGYYYTTLDANGNTIVHEIAKDLPKVDENDGILKYNGASCFPVYKSSEWVFCRYDDDQGAIVSTVRSQYMPAFKELLQVITFPEWIYDSANKCYKIEFSRKYSLSTQFRVYDVNGEEGIANDVRVVSVN